jgi:hypothetical protein
VLERLAGHTVGLAVGGGNQDTQSSYLLWFMCSVDESPVL